MTDPLENNSDEPEVLGSYNIKFRLLRSALSAFLDTLRIGGISINNRFMVAGYLIEALALFSAANSSPDDTETLPVSFGVHVSKRVRDMIQCRHYDEDPDDDPTGALANSKPAGSA